MANFDPDAYLASVQAPAPVQAPAGAPTQPSAPTQTTSSAQAQPASASSGNFDPDAYLHGAFQAQQAQSAQAMPTSRIPTLSAVPEQGTWDKIKTELRNAISPIIGETDDQRLAREQSMSQLRDISPTLAAAAESAINPEQKEFQAHGAVGAFGRGIDMALQGGGATVGAMLGAATGPAAPVMVPLLAGLGSAGGDYLAQGRRILQDEQDKVHPGELAAAGIVGAIPGGSLSGTSTASRALEEFGLSKAGSSLITEGAKQGFGGLAAETTRSVIDDDQLPTIRNAAWSAILPALFGSVSEHVQQTNPEIMAARAAAEGKIASKAAILQAGQDAGMVVEPSQVNPSMANKAIESLAGGPSIRQAATHINQDVADDVARRVLSPTNPDVDLTSDLAKAVRQQAYQAGYAPVAAAGTIPTDAQFHAALDGITAKYQGAARSFPGATNPEVEALVKGVDVNKFDAGDAISMVQILRNKASDAFQQGNTGVAQAARGAAKAIEDQIERHLTNQAGEGYGASQTLQDFRDARTLMAQSHDIEDAIREGGGSVIPSVLARKAQNQAPFTGPLKTIADFANNFPSMTREGAKTPVPGTTVTGNAGRVVMGTLLGGATATTTHSPVAATLAAAAGVLLPSVRGLVRSMVLSKPYQRIMAKFPVNVEANPDLGSLIIRQGGQAAALQGNSNAAPATPASGE